MRYLMLHFHSEADIDPREEAYVFVPGLVDKAVFPVAIDALGPWLTAFDRALDELDEQQRCPCCGQAPVDPEIAGRFSGRG